MDARREGIRVVRGDPADDRPGEVIVIPEHPSQLRVVDVDLDRVRHSYVRNAVASLPDGVEPDDSDVTFLAEDTHSSEADIREVLHAIGTPVR